MIEPKNALDDVLSMHAIPSVSIEFVLKPAGQVKP
jgi:hypothetical protein